MKRSLLLFLLQLSFFIALAQDSYFVTVVKGKVTRADGTKLATGNKLLLTDKLIFDSRESLVILLHPSKGRFMISPAKAPASASNQFTLFIKDYLELHVQNVRLSSRGMGDDAAPLIDYFTTDAEINDKILIIDTLKVPLPESTAATVDNKENFFFLQLVSGKITSHKLMVSNKTLQITRADISFNDKLYTPQDGELSLGYMEHYSTTKNANLVQTFVPVFLSKTECRNIMVGIRSAMKGMARSEIIKEIYTQLYYLYGKPDQHVIAEIYNSIK